MSIETCLSCPIAVAVFFAARPDTGQLLIISNSRRHGFRKGLTSVTGDLADERSGR